MTKFAGWIGANPQQDESKVLLSRMTKDDALKYNWSPIHSVATPAKAIKQTDRCLLITIDQAPKQQKDSLLAEYQNQGINFLFSRADAATLVLIDTEKQCLILATDALGLNNIYYAQTNKGLVFGSIADYVVRHPDVNDAISVQSIYDYVYFHHIPSPNTVYQQVKKLEGGQCLIYQNGKIRLQRYWVPDFQERHIDLNQAGRELQELLIDGVKRCSDTPENTGAFLSGGLDSSSVAGALAKVFPGQAKTFSMGFPVEGYDEIEYANIAVKHFDTRQHEYYVTPEDTFNAVPLIAAYYDEPFGNSSALAAYYCAKLAKENGITRLLGGDGGDEIFAGNERYAKQMLFEYYHRLPGFLSGALKSGLNPIQGAALYRSGRYRDAG